MSAEGAGDQRITRRGFVAAAAGAAVAGGALLEPSVGLAAAGPATLVLPHAQYQFQAVKVSRPGGGIPWRILLTAGDSTDMASAQSLFQGFLNDHKMVKGELLTFHPTGSARARFSFKGAFPASVTLVESAGRFGQGPLAAELLWIARTLRRIA